ncbi:MAG TPA: DUF1722 domain-containing protein [Clostridiales bacterium]|nr:DUF1722 domain-containing protein [Clostridiales bacterium]
MRIWDIDPGYLNRQSLLGEHRELHAAVTIIENGKKGYSNHPETKRWKEFGWALKMRHALLRSEMELRGYTDRTPVTFNTNVDKWPEIFIDPPAGQFEILEAKYNDKEQGRIPLPKTAQELWSHHKYSVIARDYNLYKEIGKKVAENNSSDLDELARLFVNLLRQRPGDKSMRNTLQHMWGYVSDYGKVTGKELNNTDQITLLKEIRKRSIENNVEYLIRSTALGELMVWFEIT